MNVRFCLVGSSFHSPFLSLSALETDKRYCCGCIFLNSQGLLFLWYRWRVTSARAQLCSFFFQLDTLSKGHGDQNLGKITSPEIAATQSHIVLVLSVFLKESPGRAIAIMYFGPSFTPHYPTPSPKVQLSGACSLKL
jgi:hypothetical protein